ncbi:hypothetical protein [Tardiphaga robiniae]|uniref:Uncharacterized protein n=1 Tax=Tardiphaga robiniae TaxID=943830 RepID=A0A163X9T4_9BRAD|nr:hypothetical protein [Tardiphaga robiniae]KZD20617.1 hypothetical protein A4A58_17920 [Tardiphaga robiniae]
MTALSAPPIKMEIAHCARAAARSTACDRLCGNLTIFGGRVFDTAFDLSRGRAGLYHRTHRRRDSVAGTAHRMSPRRMTASPSSAVPDVTRSHDGKGTLRDVG